MSPSRHHALPRRIVAGFGWLVWWLAGVAVSAPPGGLPEAAPESVGISASHLAEASTLLQTAVNEGLIAGAVAGVARNGRRVFLEAVGFLDLEQQVPMTTDAIFQIRSMSKPLTAVAALQLVEQGRLQLTEPVADYLPRFGRMFVLLDPEQPFLSAERRASRQMTIEDLLLNTAGLSHRDSVLYTQRQVRSRSESLQQMVDRMAAVPLIGDPGAQWVYSESISVLGRIIEVVSEQPLDEYLADHVLGPLEMSDTGFFVPPAGVNRIARTYNRTDSGLTPEPEMEIPITQRPPLIEGAIGIVSTVPDYLRFLQALLNGGELDGQRILSEAQVREMTRNHLPPELLPIAMSPGRPMEDRGWGYGLAVVIDADKSAFGVNKGEFGWNGSLGTYAWADPTTGTVTVLMLQIQPAGAGGLPGWFKDLIHASIIH